MANPFFNQIAVNPRALSGGYATNNKGIFSLSTSAFVVPHPEKARKGGEDSLFISRNGNIVGVADGVGGWADRGVNPSLYSKELMTHARASSNVNSDPLTIMTQAYNQTNAIGSSTCCILSLKGSHLHSANLGDSGFVVLRRGRIAYRSKPQQLSFNYPYQLGTNSEHTPQHSDINAFKITEGDLIVLASDGFWDNVYSDPVNPDCFMNLIRGKTDEKEIAKILAKTAFKITRSKKPVRTPFSDHSKKVFSKLDDITIVVSRVTSKATRVIVSSLPDAVCDLRPKPSSTRCKEASSLSRLILNGSTNKHQTTKPSSSSAPVKRWRG